MSMMTVNIHEAKTHLSKLLSRVLRGEEFVIAKAGQPIAKVVRYEEPATGKIRRIGFMKDAEWIVPDDFDDFGRDEIAEMFGVNP